MPDADSRGSYQNLLFQLEQNGVDQALVVNARIDRAEDNNEYGAEAVAAYPGRLHHVIDIDSRWGPDYHRPGAVDRLRALTDRFDPAGISHYLAPEVDEWFDSADGTAFFDLVSERRMLVSFAAPSVWLDKVRALAKRYPDIPFLINHLGVVTLHPGGVDEGLRLVLDHDDIPNLLVKVSGYYYGHDRPWDYPYLDRLHIVRAFYDSWGPGRMVWASDWPSPPAAPQLPAGAAGAARPCGLPLAGRPRRDPGRESRGHPGHPCQGGAMSSAERPTVGIVVTAGDASGASRPTRSPGSSARPTWCGSRFRVATGARGADRGGAGGAVHAVRVRARRAGGQLRQPACHRRADGCRTRPEDDRRHPR